MPNIACLNGQFLPLEEATVSIEDRGFQFGDGVYEVIRVYGGRPFRLESHLSRLAQSAQVIFLSLPVQTQKLESLIAEGLKKCSYSECKVYIQVTRGVAPRDHLFPGEPFPTFVITFREMGEFPADYVQKGVSVVTRPDLRWGRCSIKSLNLLPNVLAKQEASQAGAFEAILIKDGAVTEGTASNVVLVKNGNLVTPVLNDHLLAGVTRQAIIELAKKDGLVVEERTVKEMELKEADEIFLIGTTIEVVPISQLNGKAVGDGIPGRVTQRLRKIFQSLVHQKN